MAKQLGRSFLLKVGDGEASETFTTVAGINSKSITVNNSAIDATTPDATTPGGALWSQSMDGLKQIAVSGDGIFLDESGQEGRLNDVAMSATPTANFEILIPDFGTYSGEFRITSFELGGETEGAVTFSISLESNGEISFA